MPRKTKTEPIPIAGDIQDVPIDKVFPDPRNPRRMSDRMWDRLEQMMSKRGLVLPILVRNDPEREGCVRIINGHHRWKKMKESGSKIIRVSNVGDMSDEEALKWLLALDRIHGDPDPTLESALLKQLADTAQAAGELETLVTEMPYSQAEWNDLVGTLEPIPVPQSWEEFSLDEWQESKPKEKPAARSTYRLAFSTEDRLREFASRTTEICEEAGLIEGVVEEEAQVPVADLGDVMWALVKELNIKQAAEKVKKRLRGEGDE